MAFYKKMFNKSQGVYYPHAIVQGDPVGTEIIAKDLAKISAVSNSDVQAVLGDNGNDNGGGTDPGNGTDLNLNLNLNPLS